MIRDPIRGLHQGQQPPGCANRPDTWLHPTIKVILSTCSVRAVHTWLHALQTVTISSSHISCGGRPQLHPCTGYPAQRTARYRNEVGLSHLTKTTSGRSTARRTWPSQPIKQAAKIAARAPRPPTCRMIGVAVIAMETGRGRAPAVLASHHMHYAGLVIETDYPNRRESLNPHLAPDSSVRCNLRYVRWMRHTQEHPILAATERQTGQECYFQFLWHCQEG